MNLLIFQNPREIIEHFTFLKKKIEFSKKDRNFTIFGYVFVTRYHITLKNFSGNETNSFPVIASIFF